MTSKAARTLPKKPKPRQGTWIRVDRPYRERITNRGNDTMLIMGTEFEKSFEPDGKSTLIHLLHGQKQYAISLMPNGMLEVVALSGLEGVYQSKTNQGQIENAVVVIAKDDKELVIQPTKKGGDEEE